MSLNQAVLTSFNFKGTNFDLLKQNISENTKDGVCHITEDALQWLILALETMTESNTKQALEIRRLQQMRPIGV